MSFPVCKSSGKKIRKSRTKTLKGSKLQLTSLVDIMTILLVFLVKSFSTEGNVMNIPNDIKLPVSSARKAPKPAVVISINNRYIVAEGEKITLVKNILENDNLLILPLYKWLEQKRNLTEKIAERSTKTAFKGNVTIQGDKKIQFLLLQKIMFTCGRTGYNNFSLAVIQEK